MSQAQNPGGFITEENNIPEINIRAGSPAEAGSDGTVKPRPSGNRTDSGGRYNGRNNDSRSSNGRSSGRKNNSDDHGRSNGKYGARAGNRNNGNGRGDDDRNNVARRRRNADRTPYVRVLDYLPQGRNAAGRKTDNSPLIQGIDENTLALLEIEPLEGVIPMIGSSVAPDSDTAGRFKKRISYSDLSRGAALELPVILDEIISSQESKFIRFFNEPVCNNKFNSLRLLPGIGDKLMWAIMENGEKEPFRGFDDLCERVPSLTEPKEKIRERIIRELDHADKYHFFVIGPKKEDRYRRTDFRG